ncbi:MAG: succinate dehydrogenase, cytochrome b556 subunit [Gammaproteobacteria bacterium]
MKKQRPVFLNLMQIRLPLPGLVSILHRASGVMVFLLIPFLLWLLSRSLHSELLFAYIQQTVYDSAMIRFLLWITLSALTYHLLAGVRHLWMDVGIGESLKSARISAYSVLMLSALFTLLLGIWLW